MRLWFVQKGIKSFLLIPIIVNQEYWGIVGLEDCDKPRVWSEMDTGVLKTFATSLASAIERKKNVAVSAATAAVKSAVLFVAEPLKTSALPNIPLAAFAVTLPLLAASHEAGNNVAASVKSFIA